MKTYFFLFTFLLGGVMMKAQSSNPAVTTGQATTPATDAPSGFASPGCVELGGSISFTGQSSGTNPSSSTFLFSPFVGWFPIKGFELGFNPLSYTVNNFGNSASTSILVLFAPSCNFQTGSSVYPFIEGDIGMNRAGYNGNSAAMTGLSIGARVGLKIEIVRHAMLNVFLQDLSNSQGSEGTSVNNFVFGAGFTVAW